MAGYKIDTLLGFAFFVTIDLRAAKEPVRNTRDRVICSTKEVANIVAKTPVPLLPTVSNEAPNLVQAGCIPRLGDHLYSRERGIRLYIPQYCWAGHHLTG